MWASHAERTRATHQVVAHYCRVEPPQLQRPSVRQAQNVRPTYIKAYDTALADVDVLVLPRVLSPPPRITANSYMEALEDNLNSGPASLPGTPAVQLHGHPALAMPVGKSVSRSARQHATRRPFSDPLVFQVAYAYEHSWMGQAHRSRVMILPFSRLSPGRACAPAPPGLLAERESAACPSTIIAGSSSAGGRSSPTRTAQLALRRAENKPSQREFVGRQSVADHFVASGTARG